MLNRRDLLKAAVAVGAVSLPITAHCDAVDEHYLLHGLITDTLSNQHYLVKGTQIHVPRYFQLEQLAACTHFRAIAFDYWHSDYFKMSGSRSNNSESIDWLVETAGWSDQSSPWLMSSRTYTGLSYD